MTVRTLDDIIVATRDHMPEKVGSLFVPECVRDAERNEVERGVLTGTVLVAGQRCHTLKAGDKIMYHRSQYVPLEYEGKDFAVFHEVHVLAQLE